MVKKEEFCPAWYDKIAPERSYRSIFRWGYPKTCISVLSEGIRESCGHFPETTLRGIWKGAQISDESIEEAKRIWEKGIEKQIRMLEGEK